MKLARRMGKKLGDRKGESIAEVLLALLISCLGLVLLANMIVTSTNMTVESQELMNKYLTAENSLEEQSGTEITGTVTVEKGGAPIRLWKDQPDAGVPIYIYEHDDAKIGDRQVRSYKYKAG